MNWSFVVAGVGVAASFVTAILGLRRQARADAALNSATLVQTAFTSTHALVTALQAEVGRHAANAHEQVAKLTACEEEVRGLLDKNARLIEELDELREVLAIARDRIDRQERELATLRPKGGAP